MKLLCLLALLVFTAVLFLEMCAPANLLFSASKPRSRTKGLTVATATTNDTNLDSSCLWSKALRSGKFHLCSVLNET